MTVPVIIDVYPANSSVGIPIGDQVTVTFDQEMDETSINTGTFVLTGPDQGVFFGGEMNPFEEPGLSRKDILDSPYFGGFVQCSISFSRVDASGSPVDDDVVDYSGAGNLWQTVAILTPLAPLAPNKPYTALVAGDEDPTDAFDTGVRTRTVFDPNPISVIGTGKIYPGGGYTGSDTRTYVIEIISGGPTGSAVYHWWNKTDPFTIYNGITVTGRRELEDGLYITCDHDGVFVTGDQWEVVCVPFESLANTYRWTFNTGSGAIITPPSSASASGIVSLEPEVQSFTVVSVSPVGGKYGVVISTDPYVGEVISITFSAEIDALTLEDALMVVSEPAIGIDSANTIPYTGELDYSAEVIDDNVLVITLAPGQLYQNNIVVITLASTIADTEGNTLGEEYTTYFSTPYYPVYTSLRRIRLDLGPIATSLSDETIMLAILEASLMADATTFITSTVNVAFRNTARREYVTCMAELILVMALLGGSNSSGKMSKKLGDLSVSRTGADDRLEDTRDRLKECVGYWEIAVQTGGDIAPGTSLRPGSSVKGRDAEDAIVVSREWEATTGVGLYRPSINTTVPTGSSRRALKTWRSKGSWRTGY
jgi:hypothetical protein